MYKYRSALKTERIPGFIKRVCRDTRRRRALLPRYENNYHNETKRGENIGAAIKPTYGTSELLFEFRVSYGTLEGIIR